MKCLEKESDNDHHFYIIDNADKYLDIMTKIIFGFLVSKKKLWTRFAGALATKGLCLKITDCIKNT
jgi:hypothetical protein